MCVITDPFEVKMTEVELSGDRDAVATNLELQLSELDLVRSMYPGNNGVLLDDDLAEAAIRSYIDDPHDGGYPPPLSYVVNVSDCARLHVETSVAYPGVEQADVYLKTDLLPREAQAELNRDLTAHLGEVIEQGDLSVGVALAWIQEREDRFRVAEDEVSASSAKAAAAAGEALSFTRLWIYSHHIYSKTKRKDILDLAADHRLTGFSMPGKPGVICLEGQSRECGEAWSTIKSWNWKKINVKIQEELSLESVEDCDRERRFQDFRELNFVKPGEIRDYHMDMGKFFHFLKEHESEYMFKELFGITKSTK